MHDQIEIVIVDLPCQLMAVPADKPKVVLAERIIGRCELVVGVDDGENFPKRIIAKCGDTGTDQKAGTGEGVANGIIELADSFAAHWDFALRLLT